MRFAVPIVALAAGLAMLAQAQPLGDVEKGRAIAVGASGRDPANACIHCHGLDGAGDAAAGFPRLADQADGYLYESLKQYASGERQNPIMSPIAAALSEDEMRDAAAFYAAQPAAGHGPPPEVDPDLLQMGAVLSAIGAEEQGIQACVNCHGPEGAGLPPTYPYLAGQHPLYLEAQLRMWRDGTRRGGEANVMEFIARQMTEEQIAAVSQYFGTLRPDVLTPESGEAEASPEQETRP